MAREWNLSVSGAASTNRAVSFSHLTAQPSDVKEDSVAVSTDKPDKDSLNQTNVNEAGGEDDEDEEIFDADADGPNVNSKTQEKRIEARRLRVARKCEEARLQDLDLDPFEPVIADFVSESHRQINESRMALLKVRRNQQPRA